MANITLYEMSRELRDALDELDASVNEDGELVIDDSQWEVLAARLDGLKLSFEQKATAVAAYVNETQATAAAVKEAKDKMAKRQKALENKAKRLKQYLLDQMDAAGIRKIEGPQLRITVGKSAPAVEVLDERQIPERWWKPQPPVLDKAGIRQALKNGEEIPGAKLGEPGRSVRIA